MYIRQWRNERSLDFPERVYTSDEVKKAKELIDKGYRHTIRIKGNPSFIERVNLIFRYLRTACYYDFFRTYIREIAQIDGLTQLREADASIWANEYAVKNPVDGASLFVQKASIMKEYLNGELYYGGIAEKKSIKKRIEFLQTLKDRTDELNVKSECEKLLKSWSDSSLVY